MPFEARQMVERFVSRIDISKRGNIIQYLYTFYNTVHKLIFWFLEFFPSNPDNLPKMGLLLIVLALIFMQENVLSEGTVQYSCTLSSIFLILSI